DVETEFRAELGAGGMHHALALLNARTRYRFTGVYRAEPPLLRNEFLFDRENPLLALGGDTTELDQTYCGIVVATCAPFVAEDAPADIRLRDHAARESVVSYIGVPVRTLDGRIFGTLCHFDVRPRMLPTGEFAVLESIASFLAGWLANRDMAVDRPSR
ncbi:MAG: GAF domain-containing protein, partial [Gemmatimonadaceae bacterium]